MVRPLMTLARVQTSALTAFTPCKAEISSRQASGKREKSGIDAPCCMQTNPGMRLKARVAVASMPSATENNPTIPAIATAIPSNDSNDRIGRLRRFLIANLSMSLVAVLKRESL